MSTHDHTASEPVERSTQVDTTPDTTASGSVGSSDQPHDARPSWISSCRARLRGSLSSPWLPWVLVIVLLIVIVLLSVIHMYPYREDSSSVLREHHISLPVVSRGGYPYLYIEDPWYAHMRAMHRHHREMMYMMDDLIIRDITPDALIGQYSGTRISGSTQFTYRVSIDEKILSGTVSSTLTGSLTNLKKELQSLGISLTENPGNIQFKTDATNAQKVLQILGK